MRPILSLSGSNRETKNSLSADGAGLGEFAEWYKNDWSLLPVVVRGFRGQFQFVVHLIQKLLGLGGVAVHIPLVG